jgi:hypothetical protein
MGGRRPLKGGAPRVLGKHAGLEGRAYRRAYSALEAEYGPFSALGRLEAGRVAALHVQLQAATAALMQAQRARRLGKGRRPNAQAVEKLARRQGLADTSYAAALTALREMVGTHRTPASIADLVTRQRSRG